MWLEYVCLKNRKISHSQSLQFRTLNCNCKLALGYILYKNINAYPNGRLGQIEERSTMKALTQIIYFCFLLNRGKKIKNLEGKEIYWELRTTRCTGCLKVRVARGVSRYALHGVSQGTRCTASEILKLVWLWQITSSSAVYGFIYFGAVRKKGFQSNVSKAFLCHDIRNS